MFMVFLPVENSGVKLLAQRHMDKNPYLEDLSLNPKITTTPGSHPVLYSPNLHNLVFIVAQIWADFVFLVMSFYA